MIWTILSTTFFSPILTGAALIVAPQSLVSVMEISPVPQKSQACILEYALKVQFQDLPLPPWLSSWDHLMFNSFCDDRYDIKVDKTLPRMDVAKQILFSLASGYGVTSWHEDAIEKRLVDSALHESMETLWLTGIIPQPATDELTQEIAGLKESSFSFKKRYLSKLRIPQWQFRAENKARMGILRYLVSRLQQNGDVIMKTTTPSVCQSGNGYRGCVLWSGGSTSFRTLVVAGAITSTMDDQQCDSNYISPRAEKVFEDESGNWHSCCISNRPEECT